ncbi:MAG: hypothetical protein GY810_12770 [Aureispira sp.]|nr:hypothetical protein [Aureispira sp.]
MAKKKKLKIASSIQNKMGEEWLIQVSAVAFSEGKGANMPALGYPCAVCESTQTKLRFAESSDEVESRLVWMELQCKDCKNYTLYKHTIVR